MATDIVNVRRFRWKCLNCSATYDLERAIKVHCNPSSRGACRGASWKKEDFGPGRVGSEMGAAVGRQRKLLPPMQKPVCKICGAVFLAAIDEIVAFQILSLKKPSPSQYKTILWRMLGT